MRELYVAAQSISWLCGLASLIAIVLTDCAAR